MAFVICLAPSAQPTQGLDYRFEDIPLQEALNTIARDIQCTFAYDDALIRDKKVEQVRISNASLDRLLDQLLSPHQLRHSLEDLL